MDWVTKRKGSTHMHATTEIPNPGELDKIQWKTLGFTSHFFSEQQNDAEIMNVTSNITAVDGMLFC